MQSTKTPAFIAPPNRCDGLIIEVGASGTTHADAKRIARRLVRELLPGRWTVRPLGPKNRPARLFELTRRTPKTQPTLNQAFRWVARLKAHRDVFEAEVVVIQPGAEPVPSQVMTAAATPALALVAASDKPCTALPEWSVDLVRARQAWALPPPSGGKRRGNGIIIAHPDTGYTDHPEIRAGGRLLPDRGFDFEDERADPRDPLPQMVGAFPGHGTSTGSVIMSGEGSELADPSTFVTGLAPEAKLIPFRVSASVVHISFRKVARAIYAAIDTKAHVISMSLGGPLGPSYLHQAVRDAVDEGILVLAAAGNFWPFVVFPAALDEVIAVAAIHCQKKPWRFSARGESVDISAPGESVWKAESLDSGVFQVNRGSGTSYAVATVAGAAACWLAFHGRTKLLQKYGKSRLASVFKELLLQHGVDRPAGWDSANYGTGVLNAEKLLRAPLPTTPPAVGVSGVQFPAGAPSRNRLDTIAHYFPKTSRRQLEQTLTRLLHCKPNELDRLLSIHGSEFRFLIATIPSFRESIENAAKKHRSVTARSLQKNALLMQRISKGIRDILVPRASRSVAKRRRSKKK